ncbi:carbonic anhydrase [Penicillium brasilianum]|uniref:Carbonic anhydrase n=1 Tax=Penicillium brasilianum TaxID=104259 RepID=A0A1S9RXQ8_PENBI|nr:carbonic anhydrase [Penicillium brasilianum]
MKVTAAILPLIASATASCLHGTSLLPRSADGTVDINSFNYTNAGGPLTWYGLDAKNSACSKGKHQSPIDIVTEDIDYATANSIRFNVPSTDNAKFENLGSGLEVVLTNGTLVTSTGSYKLAQFHFHTPSEHRINEEYYPMEAHFVFENSDNAIAVVGFVFELSQFGYSTPLFDSVFAHIDDIATPGTYTKTGHLDFTALTAHLKSHGIYQYTGSLTTPPCSEDVAWFLSTEPLPLNVQSYNAVKHILKFNARYTQNALGQDNLLEVAASELN